jgi:hypothetical protein
MAQALAPTAVRPRLPTAMLRMATRRRLRRVDPRANLALTIIHLLPCYPTKEFRMPDHQTISVTGKIIHVFGHRFVVETAQGAVLADLTPHGAKQHAVRVGEVVSLSGEMKPSELKVSRLSTANTTITIEHKKPHDHRAHAEPGDAIRAARDAGFEPLGQPRRKPKHFEVLARRNHRLTELHIELNGNIRKLKPVENSDPKWSEVLQQPG